MRKDVSVVGVQATLASEKTWEQYRGGSVDKRSARTRRSGAGGAMKKKKRRLHPLGKRDRDSLNGESSVYGGPGPQKKKKSSMKEGAKEFTADGRVMERWGQSPKQ